MDSYDVVVVGSGASGLTAALTAASRGATVAIFERGRRFGGSSALSGGQLWIPNNGLQAKDGLRDSPRDATQYLAQLARGRVPEVMIRSFVANSPRALRFITENSPLVPALREDEPDYHPEWAGASRGGRTLDPGLFDGRELREEYARILHNPQYHLRGGLHTTSLEFEMLMRGEIVPGLKGRRPSTVALGEALVGALRKGSADLKVPLFLRHRARRLIVEGGKVEGIEAETPKGKKRVHARRGVILASGGFEWNKGMKDRYLAGQSENSAGCLTNTGDGIGMGMKVGAATSLMEEAWWFTLILKPGEKRGWLVTSERTLPGSIIVNGKGRRFVNEAMNYLDVARAMLRYGLVDYALENVPSFLIFDAEYLRKYPVAGESGAKARRWLKAGEDIGALADRLGVDRMALESTVKKFNENARLGRDPELHRGESYYDRHWGDPAAPYPTLAPLERPPYYGTRILAGDIGTKGGLATDDTGRVLDVDGQTIEGLYAIGNNSASVMGPGYAGSGATLGPCITFGYLAGRDCT